MIPPRPAGRVLLIALLASSGCLGPSGPATEHPNVIIILTDDQGWGDIRSHGNEILDTPTLDLLAREGARFHQFFVSPLCAPTRAALLTGRYPLRTGVHGVTRGFETMRSDEVTIAELFRERGYATAMFGKWHNGAHYPHDPNGQGFDEFVGFAAGHWNNYFDTRLTHNGQEIPTSGFISDVLTDRARAFIRGHAEEPFLLYLSYNAPHSPFQVPDDVWEKYRKRGLNEQVASVYAMVENLDKNIRDLLDELDHTGLRDRTIVAFLTDNGPNGERFNGFMREYKGSVHDGGVRVPLFIRWPGHIPSGASITQLAAHVDLLPTLADLAGIPMSAADEIDGLSLRPLLEDTDADWPHRLVFAHRFQNGDVYPTPGSVRSSRWRAVNKGNGWELYDVLNDPGERVDVSAGEPEVTRQLASAYEAWFDDVTSAGFEPIPAEVGHEERRLVVLPAHEARLHPSPGQGIRYHGGQGWANDWITGWSNLDAFASWSIDVKDPGPFDISLRYTCPEEETGSRVRIEVGGASITAIVSEAHDPPHLPSPDRVPRVEVYEKEWKDLPLGPVTLAPGVTTLYVRLDSIAGRTAMDLKAVSLSRKGD